MKMWGGGGGLRGQVLQTLLPSFFLGCLEEALVTFLMLKYEVYVNNIKAIYIWLKSKNIHVLTVFYM